MFFTNSTEVLHDQEDMISTPKCNGNDCHEDVFMGGIITYRASDSQIEKLKSLSQGCTQIITYGEDEISTEDLNLLPRKSFGFRWQTESINIA